MYVTDAIEHPLDSFKYSVSIITAPEGADDQPWRSVCTGQSLWYQHAMRDALRWFEYVKSNARQFGFPRFICVEVAGVIIDQVKLK